MNVKEILDSFGKNKREQARAEEMQRFAVGVGIAAIAGITTGLLVAPKSGKEMLAEMKSKAIGAMHTISNFIQAQSDALKDAAADTAETVSDAIEDVEGKTAGVVTEMKSGYRKIKNDVDKSNRNISKKLHESVK